MIDMMILPQSNRIEESSWSMMSNVADVEETNRTIEQNDEIRFCQI